MSVSDCYDIDGNPITVDEWAAAHRRQPHIGLDERDGVTVSTIWLGFNYNLGVVGPPLIFETMIFGGNRDDYLERYSTREQAEEGHRRACALVFGENAG